MAVFGRDAGESLMTDSQPAGKPPRGAWRLAGAGVELAASVGGCVLLGYWIDTKLDSSPWALLIGAAIGIVGGLYNLIRRSVHEMIRPPPRKKDKPPHEDGPAR